MRKTVLHAFVASVSLSLPYQAMAASLPEPVSGETVTVEPGVYEENLVIDGENTTYQCAERWACTIKSPGGEVAVNIYGKNNTLKGFEIDGSNAEGTAGIYASGYGTRVVDNYVHDINLTGDTTNSGIGVADCPEEACIIEGNKVERVGHDQLDHGIYWSSGNAIIKNNETSGAAGFGIHLWHIPENGVIDNNISHNNDSCGITVGAGEHDNSLAQNITVSNNTTYDNGYCGIEEAGNVQNNKYVNNRVDDGIDLINGEETGTNGPNSGANWSVADGGPPSGQPTPGEPTTGEPTDPGTPPVVEDGQDSEDGQVIDGRFAELVEKLNELSASLERLTALLLGLESGEVASSAGERGTGSPDSQQAASQCENGTAAQEKAFRASAVADAGLSVKEADGLNLKCRDKGSAKAENSVKDSSDKSAAQTDESQGAQEDVQSQGDQGSVESDQKSGEGQKRGRRHRHEDSQEL